MPTGERPAAGCTPADGGDGTVGLADRTGGGAPAANQTKGEPLPPAPGHTFPDDALGPVSGLDPDEMRLGAADPQAPSHPAGGRRPDHESSFVEVAVQDGSAQRTPGSQGSPEEPLGTDHDGAAQRTRGAQGSPEEPPGTDHDGSATRMTTGLIDTSTPSTSAGDARGVPVTSKDAAAGHHRDGFQRAWRLDAAGVSRSICGQLLTVHRSSPSSS